MKNNRMAEAKVSKTVDNDRVRRILDDRRESLSVEFKAWLDPDDPAHLGKILKAIYALRNFDGGFLAIGVHDETHVAQPYPFEVPLEELFSYDNVHAKVSAHASERFEVTVHTPELDGERIVVVEVPAGVRTPVLVSRTLTSGGGNKRLVEGDIYFRSLDSSGTASSVKLKTANDASKLVSICMDNRETDIGRFVRRHLTGVDPSTLTGFLQSRAASTGPTLRDRCFASIRDNEERLTAAMKRRDPLGYAMNTQQVGGLLTMRVGMCVSSVREDATPSNSFLDRLSSGNRKYTGWPAWIDMRGADLEERRPYPCKGAWETLISTLDESAFRKFEFLVYDPKGAFSLQRLMNDDLSSAVEPKTVLDPLLTASRVAEIIATGLDVLEGFDWGEEPKVGFAFEWSGLAGRKLQTWAQLSVFWFDPTGGAVALDSRAKGYVEMDLDTPRVAIAPGVVEATKGLFSTFGGFEMEPTVAEKLVADLLGKTRN